MDALPWWYRLFPLMLALASLPWSFLIGTLAMRVAVRGFRADEPWYLQARAVFPGWAAANQATIFGVIGSAAATLLCGPATPVSSTVVTFTGVLASSLGCTLALRGLMRRVGLSPTWGQTLRGWLTLLLFQWLPLWVTLVATTFVRPLDDVTAVWRLLASIVAIALAASGVGILLLRLVGVARPASERVRRLVASASQQAGHAPRFVFELDISRANAFALTSLNGVLITTPLLQALNDDELHAVLRHELGHLKEPLAVRAGRLVVACLVFSLAPLGLTLREFVWILPAVIVVLVVAVLMRRVTRKMEEHADDELGGDHATYATALETIYRVNLLPAVLRTKGTHPDLFDRMTRAGHPPSWPRPEPPARSRLAPLVIGAGFLALPLWLVVDGGPGVGLAARPEEVLLVRDQDVALVRIARSFAEDQRRDAARELLRGVVERRGDLRLPCLGTYAELGFCDEASDLFKAKDLQSDDPWAAWAVDRLARCARR